MELLNNGGHQNSNNITGGDVTTCQESHMWIHSDDKSPTVQRSEYNVCVLLVSAGLNCAGKLNGKIDSYSKMVHY